jgi:hypothetical protein
MTDHTPACNGKTTLLQTGIYERIIFAAPCFEKKETFRGISYRMILFTAERMIVTPVPSTRVQQDLTDKDVDISAVKPVTSPRPARSRDSTPLESLGSRSDHYLNREADEILLKEKDVWVIRFEDIEGIVIRRARTDSPSSRWFSILFALYSLEPAGARYSADYQLTITTPGREYILITPFSIPLKQVLVNYLGNRVHEIIDDYAPLL